MHENNQNGHECDISLETGFLCGFSTRNMSYLCGQKWQNMWSKKQNMWWKIRNWPKSASKVVISQHAWTGNCVIWFLRAQFRLFSLKVTELLFFSDTRLKRTSYKMQEGKKVHISQVITSYEFFEFYCKKIALLIFFIKWQNMYAKNAKKPKICDIFQKIAKIREKYFSHIHIEIRSLDITITTERLYVAFITAHGLEAAERSRAPSAHGL